MAEVKFHKVALLPNILEPDSWYLVINGPYAETYITNSTGAAKMVGNSTMINNLIASNGSGSSTSYIVSNIIERDALVLNTNAFVQVIDATGDSTVNSGGATYLYNNIESEFIKIAEFESLDQIINWENIVDKPSSSPEDIDNSVINSHTHPNKSLLDSLTSFNDVLLMDGIEIKNWNIINW